MLQLAHLLRLVMDLLLVLLLMLYVVFVHQILPDVTLSIVDIQFKSVVFPLPLGPIIPTKSPFSTSKFVSLIVFDKSLFPFILSSLINQILVLLRLIYIYPRALNKYRQVYNWYIYY